MPLRRHFRKDGPNYPLSGLESPQRAMEREFAFSGYEPSDHQFAAMWNNFHVERLFEGTKVGRGADGAGEPPSARPGVGGGL